MPKPSLTPDEVDSLTAKLYALSDSALVSEADLVATDFTAWLKVNFDLTAEKITYVDTFPDNVNKYWGYLFAATFITRGPVIFGVAPSNPVPRRIKETRANLFSNISYNDNDQELDGTLDVTISFKLL